MSARLRNILYWASPQILMLALYWRGLGVWFQKDDFAWLGLRGMVHSAPDVFAALFHPYAQGTIRTLSERIPFLAFPALFGLHPLPFRILAFVTAAGVLALLASVTTKLTGSQTAGFLAAIIWAINNAVAIPMAWSSIYNELAWPFTLLLAFWLLLRYVETGERRFLIAQCVVFALGFFVLETDVMYPVIASAFAILSPEARKRGLLKKIIPLFVLSIVYTAIHFYVAPLAASGPYALHWDSKMLQTLTTYWGWALGPGEGRLIGIVSTLVRSICVWALTAGLVAFLILQSRRGGERETVSPVLFVLWFLIALAPLLPLRDHITVEYLTTPALGLAMWSGWATASAWRQGVIARLAALALCAIYAGFSIPIGQAHLRSFVDRSRRIETFVESVVATARANPGKSILLTGVNAELSDDAVHHRALEVFGAPGVRIVPGAADITALPPGSAIVLDVSR